MHCRASRAYVKEWMHYLKNFVAAMCSVRSMTMREQVWRIKSRHSPYDFTLFVMSCGWCLRPDDTDQFLRTVNLPAYDHVVVN